jgi:clusterin-associated protein 1
VENFRTPNFPLVADILYWMIQRYDPLVSISDDIETENDRVAFVTNIVSLMLNKAGIKLNGKKIYSADGHAVKEMLKITDVLYAAQQTSSTLKAQDDSMTNSSAPTAKVTDVKALKKLATEITETGAKVYDLLQNEDELRKTRMKALKFLEASSNSLAGTTEHDFIEKSVKLSIKQSEDNLVNMEKQIKDLKGDEETLVQRIQKKNADLERNEKRLKSLKTVRPAFMDEYERLEVELGGLYEIYLERFRNLDFLEHELELIRQSEKNKAAETKKHLKKMQERIKKEEERMMHGANEEKNIDSAIESRGIPVKSAASKGGIGKKSGPDSGASSDVEETKRSGKEGRKKQAESESEDESELGESDDGSEEDDDESLTDGSDEDESDGEQSESDF